MNRLAAVAALYLILALAAGCTSDPETPLGSDFVDDGLIQSQPGEVFQDTFPVVSGDAVFPVNSLMAYNDRMWLGRRDDFESWMIVRPNFSTAGEDTLLVVDEAWILLTLISAIDTSGVPEFGAVFNELEEPYSESDTLFDLPLGDPIPDDTQVNTDRIMTNIPRSYNLDPQVVQEWIRGDRPNNGFAVVLNDPTVERMIEYGSRLYPSPSDDPLQNKPLLQVVFTNGKQSTYQMLADGTFVQDHGTTTNLLLSDGTAQRVFIPVDLSIVDPETFVHEATLEIFIVPDSRVGTDFSLTLYIPESVDFADPGILSGTLVTAVVVPADFEKLKFSIRNALQLMLSQGRDDAGFVLQFTNEGTAMRRMEFYTSSAADSLKPTYRFTLSAPAEFGK